MNWIGPCERDEMEELDMEARSWHTSKLDDAMVYLQNLLHRRRLSAIEAMSLMKENGILNSHDSTGEAGAERTIRQAV